MSVLITTRQRHATAALLSNRFERFVFGDGLFGWIYEFRNKQPLPIAHWLSSGFEIDVQLSQDWLNHGSNRGTQLCAPGEITLVNPTEQYTYSFEASRGTGRQVGFMVFPNELERYTVPGYDLVFPANAAKKDPEFYAFCSDLYEALSQGDPISVSDVRAQVFRFVDMNAQLVRADAVAVARAEIERTFDRPVYIADFAGFADMHPTTFSRHFIRRYGLTPTRYRLELRINAAIRLCWSRPDLSLKQIAELVGFEDMPYFYRVVMQKSGMTPAELGRR